MSSSLPRDDSGFLEWITREDSRVRHRTRFDFEPLPGVDYAQIERRICTQLLTDHYLRSSGDPPPARYVRSSGDPDFLSNDYPHPARRYQRVVFGVDPGAPGGDSSAVMVVEGSADGRTFRPLEVGPLEVAPDGGFILSPEAAAEVERMIARARGPDLTTKGPDTSGMSFAEWQAWSADELAQAKARGQ